MQTSICNNHRMSMLEYNKRIRIPDTMILNVLDALLYTNNSSYNISMVRMNNILSNETHCYRFHMMYVFYHRYVSIFLDIHYERIQQFLYKHKEISIHPPLLSRFDTPFMIYNRVFIPKNLTINRWIGYHK